MASEAEIISTLVLKGLEPYTSGLRKATGAAESAGTAQEDVAKKSKLSASQMIRAAAAAGIVYKGYNLLKGSIDTTVELAKETTAFSRVSGLDAKQAQAWILVARERGIQAKTLQVGMATLGRQLGALGGTPSKSSIAALQKLGLSQQALLKMPMTERMDKLADAFDKLPNGVTKAALSQRLFGRSGQSLLPIFKGGAKGMNELTAQAAKLVPNTAASTKAALDLAHRQRELNTAMMGVKVAMGEALIPVLSAAQKIIQPVAEWFGRLLKIVPPLGPALVALGAALAGLLIFDKISSAVESFTGAWEAMTAAIGISELIIFGVVLAIAALVIGLIIAYKKVGWFRDFVNGAFNAIKDVVTAVVGWIEGHWKLLAVILATILLGPIAGMVAAFFLLRDKIHIVLDFIKNGFTVVKNWILARINDIVGFFANLGARIAGAASGLFDSIKGAATAVMNFVHTRVDDIVNFIIGLPGRIKSGLGNLASTIGGVFKDAFSAIPDIIKAPINWIIRKIDAINIKIPSFVPGLGGHHLGFNIPQLATGGTVTQTGMAIVGERGPEIVTLPGGASVVPLPAPPTLLDHRRRPIIVQTFLEKRQIGEAVAEYAGDLQAAR